MVTSSKEISSCTTKPLLSVEEQIAHLKAKGVVFELCSEDSAAQYLADRTYLFKIASYRKSPKESPWIHPWG